MDTSHIALLVGLWLITFALCVVAIYMKNIYIAILAIIVTVGVALLTLAATGYIELPWDWINAPAGMQAT